MTNFCRETQILGVIKKQNHCETLDFRESQVCFFHGRTKFDVDVHPRVKIKLGPITYLCNSEYQNSFTHDKQRISGNFSQHIHLTLDKKTS